MRKQMHLLARLNNTLAYYMSANTQLTAINNTLNYRPQNLPYLTLATEQNNTDFSALKCHLGNHALPVLALLGYSSQTGRIARQAR